MKRALALTSSLLILAGCGGEPAPPPPGGQSGDDGDVSGDEGGPQDPTPGLPPDPCERELTPLPLDAATPFGASALELVSNVAPADESPLFWVSYSEIAGVTYTPGPGESSIALGIEARAGTEATLETFRPRFENSECQLDQIRVPVRVTLQSADGALDASSDAVLLFTSAASAELQTGFAMDALGGSFAFDSLGDPARRYIARGIAVEAQLWPGGSRGTLYPTISEPGPGDSDFGASPPPPNPGGELQGMIAPPSTPAPFTPTPGIIAGTVIPDDWSAVAVWPRREACTGDGRGGFYPFAPDDRVIGSSLNDIIEAVNAQGPFTVSLGDATASLRFEAQAPGALHCATPMASGTVLSSRGVTFDVQATLRAEDADDSALAALDTTSIFEITATSAADGTLAQLRWARRDLVHGQSRSAFESATGLTLDAPDEYEQLWWSWHASDTRASSTGPWSPRGALVVSALNAEQAAEVARIQALGGPGVGISLDEATKFPILPGDALIDAEIVP